MRIDRFAAVRCRSLPLFGLPHCRVPAHSAPAPQLTLSAHPFQVGKPSASCYTCTRACHAAAEADVAVESNTDYYPRAAAARG